MPVGEVRNLIEKYDNNNLQAFFTLFFFDFPGDVFLGGCQCLLLIILPVTAYEEASLKLILIYGLYFRLFAP